jgi:hypothetical protein
MGGNNEAEYGEEVQWKESMGGVLFNPLLQATSE